MNNYTHTLTVEFDDDDERIYAYLESIEGEFVRDFDFHDIADMDNLINQSELLEAHGRWDGETSTKLCPAYEGRACTTGGHREIYGLDYFDAAYRG